MPRETEIQSQVKSYTKDNQQEGIKYLFFFFF